MDVHAFIGSEKVQECREIVKMYQAGFLELEF